MRDKEKLCIFLYQIKLLFEFFFGSWDDMKNIKWITVIEELKMYAPILFGMLNACTLITSDKRNRIATIGICASILLQYRCHHMNLVQKIIMLILYGSHCGKQVSI